MQSQLLTQDPLKWEFLEFSFLIQAFIPLDLQTKVPGVRIPDSVSSGLHQGLLRSSLWSENPSLLLCFLLGECGR